MRHNSAAHSEPLKQRTVSFPSSRRPGGRERYATKGKPYETMSNAKKALIVIVSLVLLLLLIVSAPIIYIELGNTEVPAKEVVNPSILQEPDRQFLVSRGLTDPVNDIVRDLRSHPELIPCKGTLAGTPGFDYPEEIIVHGRDRVTATFSDGHYDGTIELGFKVSEDNITWKPIKWDCQGYD